jgi:hypothetical protein
VSAFAVAALVLAAVAVVAALVVARRRADQHSAGPGQPSPAPSDAGAPESGG